MAALSDSPAARLVASLSLVGLAACASNTPQMPAVAAPDGQASPSPTMASLEREALFWRTFEIDGEWVEFFPTLPDLARGSDVGVIGRIGAVSRGATISSGAGADMVFEADVRVEVLETLRGDEAVRSPIVTLIIPRVRSDADADVAIGQLVRALPQDPVVIFLRKRAASGKFRPVNGYGLWARTLRSPIDAPLNPEPGDQSFYAEFLRPIASIEQLAAALKR